MTLSIVLARLDYSRWLNNAYIFWLIFVCGACFGGIAVGLLNIAVDNWKQIRALCKRKKER